LPDVEDHRVALAGALCVPDDTGAAVRRHRLGCRLDRPFDGVYLVVLRRDLGQLSTGLLEEDEITDEIEETRGREDAADQNLERRAALHLGLIHRLPLGEV